MTIWRWRIQQHEPMHVMSIQDAWTALCGLRLKHSRTGVTTCPEDQFRPRCVKCVTLLAPDELVTEPAPGLRVRLDDAVPADQIWVEDAQGVVILRVDRERVLSRGDNTIRLPGDSLVGQMSLGLFQFGDYSIITPVDAPELCPLRPEQIADSIPGVPDW